MASASVSFDHIFSEKLECFLDTNRILKDLSDSDLAYLLRHHKAKMPKDLFFGKLFPECSSYSFPSLEKDSNGFVKFIYKFQPYETFFLERKKEKDDSDNFSFKPVFTNQEMERDFKLEAAILGNSVELYISKPMMIDLTGDNFFSAEKRDFTTHTCSVYPEKIKDIPEIFDTMYWTDFLLKYIYRMFVQVHFHEFTRDQVLAGNTFLGTVKEHVIVEAKRRQEYVQVADLETVDKEQFGKLVDLLFLSKSESNSEEFASWKESYLGFERSRLETGMDEKPRLKVYLDFKKVTIEHMDGEKGDMDVYKFKNDTLKPECVFFLDTRTLLPKFVEPIKTFIEENFKEISSIFPIFKKLENIVRLQAILKACSGLDLESDSDLDSDLKIVDFSDCIKADRFPHSISVTGGIKIETELVIEKKVTVHDPELVKVCKKAFHDGGLICSLAPKLKIRECFDKNEKDYHACLEPSEKLEK